MIDEVVFDLIEKEKRRQQMTLSMIAAENTAPKPILEALGSYFNNKTAEGYPAHRYHTGCQVADELEQLAINRCKSIFGAEHANVQAHSGVNANLAVYSAMLEPGDTVISMKLSHGGHLSHGDHASITSRIYRFDHYGVNPNTELLDYDEIRRLALKRRPRMIIAGASSYPRLIDYVSLRSIADEISAFLLVDMAHIAGLVAAQVIPSPVPYADFVTFTTYKTMMGPHGGVILSKKIFSREIDHAVFPGTQGTPTLSLVAGKAICFRLATTRQFIQIQKATLKNAQTLANELSTRGYRPVTGGTDNHLVLIDLRSKGLKGNVVERALEEVGILANRNVIPYDPESTQTTSGLRMGTQGISARGLREGEIKEIANLIDQILSALGNNSIKIRVQKKVHNICIRFPINKGLLSEKIPKKLR